MRRERVLEALVGHHPRVAVESAAASRSLGSDVAQHDDRVERTAQILRQLVGAETAINAARLTDAITSVWSNARPSSTRAELKQDPGLERAVPGELSRRAVARGDHKQPAVRRTGARRRPHW